MNPFDVKACRKRLGLNQTQLGRVLGVTERQVRRWEKHTSLPQNKHLLHMRQLLLTCETSEPTILTKAKAAPSPVTLSPLGILPANF